MTLARVRDVVGTLPYMRYEEAERLLRLIDQHALGDCLELGFFHGVSSCYIAEILRERGGGHLTTVGQERAREREPNIDTLLGRLGLQSYVTVHYEPRSYTWRLMKLLEAHAAPAFDFCYVDGGHDWDTSGFAFFLVEKLLRPGGWLVFDDLDWSGAHSLRVRRQRGIADIPAGIKRMTDEELHTPQVRKVWELLVKTHSSFAHVHEEGQWGFAQKKR
jgi:predicted O-methyltransferase YrrM